MANRIDRIGEEKTNNFGSLMRITNYRNCNDIDVYFEKYNYTKEHTRYYHFERGDISCPYEKRVFNIGYLGEGRYNASINRKSTKCYDTWQGMLTRCYDSKFIQKYPTYERCRVHESWHNFQVFGKWYYDNFYQIEGQRMELDKDILCKGNKIYSPNTCVFVPQNINKLFTKRDNDRGNCPVGVYYDKSRGKYKAYCNVNGQQKHLGRYKTPEEAFQVYKKFKEKYIKEVAEEYKNEIPSKLYKALMRYEVEIDD